MQTRIACLCFLIIICLSGWSLAAFPNQLVIQGRLTSSDATVIPGTRDLWVYARVGRMSGTAFAMDMEFSQRVTFKDGYFELILGGDPLKNLNYLDNDYYLQLLVENAPGSGAFTTLSPPQKLAGSAYSFNAHNLKGGPVYAVGNPPVKISNRQNTGILSGSNAGIEGKGVFSYFDMHYNTDRTSGTYRTGTMEVMGNLGYQTGGKYYGVYASNPNYDPRISYNPTTGYNPKDYGNGAIAKAMGGGTKKGIAVYGRSNSASKAAIYCENTNSFSRGAALNLDGDIQFLSGSNAPVGQVSFPPTSTYLDVANTLVAADSVILLTVQNGYWERIYVHSINPGVGFRINRNLLDTVLPRPTLQIAYFIIK